MKTKKVKWTLQTVKQHNLCTQFSIAEEFKKCCTVALLVNRALQLYWRKEINKPTLDANFNSSITIFLVLC